MLDIQIALFSPSWHQPICMRFYGYYPGCIALSSHLFLFYASFKIFIFRVVTMGAPICFIVSSECICELAVCFLTWKSRITCFPGTIVGILPCGISFICTSSMRIMASQTIFSKISRLTPFLTTIVTPW